MRVKNKNMNFATEICGELKRRAVKWRTLFYVACGVELVTLATIAVNYILSR